MSAALAVVPYLWACEELPQHAAAAPKEDRVLQPVQPELAFYRKYTEAMLRRYMRFSMESGRVPSMLGQEMFRGRVTNYRVRSFEDVVIFVHDVERCLGRLNHLQQLLITRIAVQEYTHEEAATMMGVPRRTIVRRYMESLDRLTSIFLEYQLLEPLAACQERSFRR